MELVKWRRWSNHGRHSSGSTAANSLCPAASNSSWNMSRYRTARVASSTSNQLLTNCRADRHRPAFIFNPVKSSVKRHTRKLTGQKMKYFKKWFLGFLQPARLAWDPHSSTERTSSTPACLPTPSFGSTKMPGKQSTLSTTRSTRTTAANKCASVKLNLYDSGKQNGFS